MAERVSSWACMLATALASVSASWERKRGCLGWSLVAFSSWTRAGSRLKAWE